MQRKTNEIDHSLKNGYKRKVEEQREEEIRKDAIMKAKPRCSICGYFINEQPICTCTGNQGSGNEAKKVNGKDGSKQTSPTSQDQKLGLQHQKDHRLLHELHFDSFDSNVISEMLSYGLLVIDHDQEMAVLSIKLQCRPSEKQKQELHKYLTCIKKEFENEKSAGANCTVTHDEMGNITSLRITFLSLNDFKAFIQRLGDKQFLPKQIVDQQPREKVVYPSGVNHFNQTPRLTMQPQLTGKRKQETKPEDDFANKAKKRKMEEIAQQEKQVPAAMRPKSLLDGLKPKGWVKE